MYDVGPQGGALVSEPQFLSAIAVAETAYPHSMGRPPDYSALKFTCAVANSNWVPGESFVLTEERGFQLVGLADKVIVSWEGSNGANILLPARDGSTSGIITTTSWRFEVIAVWWPRI